MNTASEPALRPHRFYASTGGSRTHLLHPPQTENTGAESGTAEIIALTMELYYRGKLLLTLCCRGISLLMGSPTGRRYYFYASSGRSCTHLLYPPKTENIGAGNGGAMDTDGATV